MNTMNADQVKVFNYVNSLPHVGPIQFIQWNPSIMSTNNAITVSLPGVNGGVPINFEQIGAYFSSSTEYSLTYKSSLGQLTIYKTPAGTGGTININNQSFTIWPISNNNSLFFERNLNNLEYSNSSNDVIAESCPDGYCNPDCGDAIVDVLVMVTPEANAWLDQKFGDTFKHWFLHAYSSNINSAFGNSNIFNKRVRNKYIFLENSIELVSNIVQSAENLGQKPVYQNKLNQSGCDVGMFLTFDQTYNNEKKHGGANSSCPFSINKFCIAQVDKIDESRYTFAHELAHQFGCFHSSDAGLLCNHGKNLLIGRHTIMANEGETLLGEAIKVPDYSRIMNYSNPDVFFSGEATGDNDGRDNAKQIRGAMCTVAAINTPTWFSANLSPLYPVVCEDLPFTIDANVILGSQQNGNQLLDCSGPYTYLWSWSSNADFLNPTYISTTVPVLTMSQPPFCPAFYLNVKVISVNGCQAENTAFFKCHCSNNQHRSITKTKIPSTFVELSPNPTDNFTDLLLSDDQEVEQIIARDEIGSSILINSFYNIEKNAIRIQLDNLKVGIWFLDIKLRNNKFLPPLRLVIMR